MDRLNKVLAHAGVGSRRRCDELIATGRVAVDGHAVRELGTRVDPETQAITVDGEPIREERHVYWLVNKPRGFLSTNRDPGRRPRVIDLVPHISQRVYTVGRLDESSEGAVLLTNDGDLAFALMHPRFGVPKTYLAQVVGRPTPEDLQRLTKGIWLSDGRVKVAGIKRLKTQGESTWLRITLREGKNREIRRMLASLEHKVLTLKRLAIGPVQLGNLRRGKSRRLSGEEVQSLRGSVERHGQQTPNHA
jgi:23S rRNA pseudouridine2605 synthase